MRDVTQGPVKFTRWQSYVQNLLGVVSDITIVFELASSILVHGDASHYLAILDHKASKEDPPVRAPLSHQGVSSALHYLLHHLLLYVRSDCWGRGVGPHAACVGPSITLTYGFVILHRHSSRCQYLWARVPTSPAPPSLPTHMCAVKW